MSALRVKVSCAQIRWLAGSAASVGAALLLASTGCTQVTSKPVVERTCSTSGVTYCLPKPVIRVVPQGDGTLKVGVEYLPDSGAHVLAVN